MPEPALHLYRALLAARDHCEAARVAAGTARETARFARRLAELHASFLRERGVAIPELNNEAVYGQGQ
jgi:hypothetical protein